MKPRLVCFFSVGTTPQETEYAWEGRRYTSRYVIDAALHLGVIDRADSLVVFAPILTDETRGKIAEALQTTLVADGDRWDPIKVDSAGRESVEQVVGAMLQKVQDGDRVFVEPTNGLRSFQMALLAGSLFLRALRAEVRVERLVYGELSTKTLHDITPVLDLFDWTRDAHAFADALNAGPLLGRLRGTQKSGLDKLAAPLAGGLAPQILSRLRRLALPQAIGLAEREALALVERRLATVAGLARRTKKDALDVGWLDAELAFVELLSRAGRLGDAVRALREWCVNVVLFARGDGASRWYTVRIRGPAERWLSERTGKRTAETPENMASLVRCYDAVQQLRNELSHSGYQNGEDQVPQLDRARSQIEDARCWWTSVRETPLHISTEPVLTRSVFLDLSSHSDWSEAQTNAALALGASRVEHRALPAVDPDADDLSGDAAGILSSVGPEVGWALVQGEPVLTMWLVRGLQARGVQCYVATTERAVSSGTETTSRRFHRFREWPAVR